MNTLILFSTVFLSLVWFGERMPGEQVLATAPSQSETGQQVAMVSRENPVLKQYVFVDHN